MKGLVVCSTGMVVDVKDLDSNQIVKCRVRGKLRLNGARSTSPVVVGDIVEYTLNQTDINSISEIKPRENYIIRKSPNLSKESHIIAANIDQAAIVVSLITPKTNPEFIDRFLVTCEAYKIPAIIVLNKIDLARQHPQILENFIHIYSLAGYKIVETSAENGENLETLKSLLNGKVTLLSGNSGVGKSTIINSLIPNADAKTGGVSNSHSKGKHTTTFSKMFEIQNGGYIIDTPGIKGFGLIDIENNEICRYFPDLMKYSPDCQFYNCKHINEPGCNIIKAVTEGKISINRYESYLKLMDEENQKYRQ